MATSTLLFATLALCSQILVRSLRSHAYSNEGAQEAALEEAFKAQQQLTAGHILRERFVLKEHLGSTPGYELRERDEGPGVPGIQFPDTGKMVKYAAYGTSHLGTGSFGDTWKAYDINLRKYVAVKIFYTRGGGMPAAGFLTPHTVRVMGAKVKSMVQEAVEECTAVKTMVRGEHGIGPQRLCQCFEDHVNDASEHEPIFLVLELCGKSLTEKLRSRTATWAWRKKIIIEMLEGVEFMASKNKIHHDLKPDNVCVTDDDHVKLIDFGGLQTYNSRHDNAGCVSTEVYSAPEWHTLCFDRTAPAATYDSYTVGLMLMEFMCGSVHVVHPGRSLPCTSQLYGSDDTNAMQTAKFLTQASPRSRWSPRAAIAKLQERAAPAPPPISYAPVYKPSGVPIRPNRPIVVHPENRRAHEYAKNYVSPYRQR